MSAASTHDIDPTVMRSIRRASMVLGAAAFVVGIDGVRLGSGHGKKGIAIGAPHELLLNHMNVTGAIVFIVAGMLTFASAFRGLGPLRVVASAVHLVCFVIIIVTLRVGKTDPLAAEGGTLAWHLGLGAATAAIALTLRAAHNAAQRVSTIKEVIDASALIGVC